MKALPTKFPRGANMIVETSNAHWDASTHRPAVEMRAIKFARSTMKQAQLAAAVTQ